MEANNKLLSVARSSIRFGLYLLFKLPAAFFSGIRIVSISQEKCITSVPFKWLTQNPFRSTYFASLAMAAEMSTGILALGCIYKRNPSISMLVTKMEASYFKKAVGVTLFTCEEGLRVMDTVKQELLEGKGSTITVKSSGRNQEGELIAEFLFTWSFKLRKLSKAPGER